MNEIEKKTKPQNKSQKSHVYLRKDTKKKIQQDLSKINKKDFGRTVRPDDYIALAISLVTPEHLTKLQESSLSNKDRFDRDYRTYVAQNGSISKDAYLGIRLQSQVAASNGVTESQTSK